MSIEYLSEEEQYKENLNQDEISRIKDYNLREIRQKYWKLRHEAFLNEHEIPDSEISSVWNELKRKELAEIEEYRKSLEK